MPKDHEITKLYYSISEVAQMFDVSNSLLRFWETEFGILKPKKNRKGDRRYTQKDIENIRLIFQLVKEQGYTLEGAKRQLKENRKQLEKKMETLGKLKELRTFLNDLREEI